MFTENPDNPISDSEEFRYIATSADSQILAAALGHKIVLWDLSTNKRLMEIENQGSILSMAFSPDSEILAAGNYNGSIHLWNRKTGEILHSMNAEDLFAWSVAINSNVVACASGDFSSAPVGLWDIVSGEQICTIDVPGTALAFSSDGVILAVAGERCNLSMWNVTTKERLRSWNEALEARIDNPQWETINSVALSPDDRLIAAPVADRVVIFSTDDGKVIQDLETARAFQVGFCANGTVLAASDLSSVSLWNLESGKPAHRIDGSYFAPIRKNSTIAICQKRSIHIVDVNSAKIERTFDIDDQV